MSVSVSTPFKFKKFQSLGRTKEHLHLGRRLYHACMGVLCFYIYAFWVDQKLALKLILVIGGSLILLDILRFKNSTAKKISFILFNKIVRREEIKNLSGNTFFVLGLFVTVLLFPKSVVLLSVLFLALGDPVAAIVGIQVGKTRLWKNKSFEGALANFVVAVLISLVYYAFYIKGPQEKGFLFALLGGFSSTIAEILPLPLNDNMTIPIISGFLLFFGMNLLSLL